MSVNDTNTGAMASTKKKHFIPLGNHKPPKQTQNQANNKLTELPSQRTTPK